jgi:hypothetical protein
MAIIGGEVASCLHLSDLLKHRLTSKEFCAATALVSVADSKNICGSLSYWRACFPKAVTATLIGRVVDVGCAEFLCDVRKLNLERASISCSMFMHKYASLVDLNLRLVYRKFVLAVSHQYFVLNLLLLATLAEAVLSQVSQSTV